MMKRVLSLILCLVLVSLCPLSALAATATPTGKLPFRTGPNGKYVELYSLPQETKVTPLEYEETGNNLWILLEYTRNGKLERAYTTAWRMTIVGDVPWASHLNIASTIAQSATVYSGPGYDYCTRTNIDAGQDITILEYDGEFVFIEFYDNRNGAPTRGWVTDDHLYSYDDGYDYDDDYGEDWYGGYPASGYESQVWFSNGTLVVVTGWDSLPMYDSPFAGSHVLAYIPAGTVLDSYATTGTGHLYVEYNGKYGFIDKGRVSIY